MQKDLKDDKSGIYDAKFKKEFSSFILNKEFLDCKGAAVSARLECVYMFTEAKRLDINGSKNKTPEQVVGQMESELNARSSWQMYIFLFYSSIAFLFGVVGLLLNGNIPPAEEPAGTGGASAGGEGTQLLQARDGAASGSSSSPQEGTQQQPAPAKQPHKALRAIMLWGDIKVWLIGVLNITFAVSVPYLNGYVNKSVLGEDKTLGVNDIGQLMALTSTVSGFSALVYGRLCS